MILKYVWLFGESAARELIVVKKMIVKGNNGEGDKLVGIMLYY